MAIFPLSNATATAQQSNGIELPIQSLDALDLSTDGGSVQESATEPDTPAKDTITSQKINVSIDSDDGLPARSAKRRRDSLVRREALLRGKEGSRRRQRWENGQWRTVEASA